MKGNHAREAGNESGGLEHDFQHYAMLRISSEQPLDLDGISSALGVMPTRIRRRSVRSGSHREPSAEDAWMYQPSVAAEADLYHHIDALWQLLRPHVEFIKRMKTEAKVVVHLGYLSRMNSAGVSIPHDSLEMFRTLGLDFHLHITVLPDEGDKMSGSPESSTPITWSDAT